jgi:hypothetical protein
MLQLSTAYVAGEKRKMVRNDGIPVLIVAWRLIVIFFPPT